MSTAVPATKPSAPSMSPKPIDVLQSQPAQVYAHLHPILLTTLLLINFKALVQDPVGTLLGLAPAVAALQAVYCVVCLPYTGQAPVSTHRPGQKKKTVKAGQDAWARAVPVAISLVLTLALTTPTLYIILILFGAPLTTHQPHTLLLAGQLALLTTPQLFYTHGMDPQAWLRIVSLQIPVDEAYGMSLGACFGSWVGAIPIPLDWDREWQKWPVTIVAGMYAGAVVGKFAGGYLFKGWNIKIS